MKRIFLVELTFEAEDDWHLPNETEADEAIRQGFAPLLDFDSKLTQVSFPDVWDEE